jgi:hypothetical protein
MKEFLQVIIRFNLNIIESIVHGVSVFIFEKVVAKMLYLL